MTQKKKTAHKRTHKKSHSNKYNAKIIYQTMPNYSSSQLKGHQNNNNVQFGPQPQQESRTDNLVGDLISKLITKIETDGNQQTQQYSREIQPINNNNNINIYNNVPGTTTTETKTETNTGESIADAVANGIKSTARSAGEDFGIATAAGAASLIGVGALGVAYNSDTATKAKLKLKKVGGGILGAVTSGAGAIGSAINNNILKRGTKLGGDKTTTNLIKEEGKIYGKKGKGGTYARLEDEINPLQADFDKHISEPTKTKVIDNKVEGTPKELSKLKPLPPKKTNTPTPTPTLNIMDTPTPTPTKAPIDTSIRRINMFSPAYDIASLRPQNIFSPPINLRTTPKTKYIEPVGETVKKMNAGDRIKARIKMKTNRENYLDLREVNSEANKIQNAYRNFKAKNIVKSRRTARNQTPIEVSSTVQPARLSDVHTTTRQGATTTRGFEQNQAIGQLVRQQQPARQSSETAISGATTAAPQPRQYFTSDNPEYRKGQKARAKDGAKFRPLVEVLKPDNPYNQGYFGDALQQGLEGYHAREVRTGPRRK